MSKQYIKAIEMMYRELTLEVPKGAPPLKL